MEEHRQLPVNVRQVGSADPIYTVYVEDYVETYIRKQKYTEKKPVVTGYLYGKTLLVEGEQKCLIYGAAEDGRLNKDRGQDRGKKHFPEHTLLGWFVKGEKDKLPAAEEQNRLASRLGLPEGGVLYIGDGENSVMLSLRGGTLFPLSGHMIFYERNEAMQEYMIRTGDGKSIETETVDQAAVHFREIMQKKEETAPVIRKRAGGRGVVKAASFLAVLLLGGSLVLAGNDRVRRDAFVWVEQLMSPSETESDIAVNVIHGDVEPTESQPPETEPGESDLPETTPSAPPETTVTPTPETAPVIAGVDHVVSVGETLHGILKMHYGNESRLQEICRLNHIENPDEIFAGQVIHLP